MIISKVTQTQDLTLVLAKTILEKPQRGSRIDPTTTPCLVRVKHCARVCIVYANICFLGNHLAKKFLLKIDEHYLG